MDDSLGFHQSLIIISEQADLGGTASVLYVNAI